MGAHGALWRHAHQRGTFGTLLWHDVRPAVQSERGSQCEYCSHVLVAGLISVPSALGKPPRVAEGPASARSCIGVVTCFRHKTRQAEEGGGFRGEDRDAAHGRINPGRSTI